MAEPWEAYQAQGSAAAVAEPWDVYLKGGPQKEDIPRALASGAKRGTIGLLGMFGDIANLFGNIGNKLNLPQYEVRKPLGQGIWGTGLEQVDRQPMNTYAGVVPTGGQINAAVDDLTGSKPYVPQTQGEKFANAIGYAAPTMLAAPQTGLARALTATVVGGAGSEGARQLAETYAPDWQDEAAVLGGVLGGTIGAKVPGPGMVDARLSAIADELTADPSTMGMMGGNIKKKGPKQPPGPDVQVNRKFAEREGYLDEGGLEQFDQLNDNYTKAGVDPFKFQIYGNAQKVGALASQSGKTARRVKDVLDGPIAEGPPSGAIPKLQDRALSNLDEMTGGAAPLKAALDEAAEAYGPTLGPDVVTPVLRQQMQQLLTGLSEAHLKKITAAAEDLGRAEDALRVADGKPPYPMTEARRYQLTKRATYTLSQHLLEQSDTAPLGQAYGQLFNRMQRALHDETTGIPGYKAVDEKWSGLKAQLDADTLLRKKIEGKTEGYNPGSIGRNRVTLRDLERDFGSEKAGRFALGQRLIAKDADEYNQAHPDKGSQTAIRIGEMLDNAGEVVRAGKKGPLEIAGHLLGDGWDFLTGEFAEGVRNDLGVDLTTRLTPAERAAFRAKLAELAAKKKAEDLAAALAQTSATQGGGNAAQ
jgi:hypothetical protein